MSVYIVTGASRGLGLEFVKQLAEAGKTVFACARNPQKSEKLSVLIDNKHVFGIKLDTTSTDSIQTAAKEIDEKAPNGVNVLINNAGISGDAQYDVLTTPESDYVNVFKTNVVGVSNVVQGFLPLLRKSGDGVKKIMNMSSILGSIAAMEDGSGWGFGSSYCVSKAAVNMMTKMMSNALAKENFIVYASHPGWCDTDMGSSKAPTRTEDSIKGQLVILDRLTAKDNGAYIDFEGNHLNW
ncbi:4-dihydrotrisporin dehydrogenase [Backusella circina FSU 941]|nr:4-dihydrotrisporin dehydrogenase [Backusella circina FSU 941]